MGKKVFTNIVWMLTTGVSCALGAAVYYTCILNQIIHKHVHVDYNPLKGMLVLISSLKLSIVSYGTGPESWGHLRTAYGYRCQTASQVSLFVGFLISWISLPTKTTKIGTPQIKVISQYFISNICKIFTCYLLKGAAMVVIVW